MNHKVILFLLATSVLTYSQITEAQQATKIPRMGG